MINKEFIPYEQALALKELGFDDATSFYWENNIIKPLPMKDEVGAFHFNRYTRTENEWICAPLYQQAFRWFREKYDLHVQIRKENYFQQSAYEYFHFDISKGQEVDITKQEDLLGEIFEESSQDIPGNHLNDEKFSKLIFERKFAFKTYEEIESYCLKKLIEIVKQ